HKQKEQAVDLSVVVVKRATVKKGAQVAKIPNPRAAAAENIKVKSFIKSSNNWGEQRVDLGLPTAIDLGAGKEAAAKAQNGGERKCEATATNVIIISTKFSNGRAVKERPRKKKTGRGLTFTSLLTARSKEAAAIGGVAKKREDLIIVNIDEASGDDVLAVAEYAEDIYKFYKLTEAMINFFFHYFTNKNLLSVLLNEACLVWFGFNFQERGSGL
ncbi:hypothetical protein Dimus_001134, partial [Dionaea muscipula]